MKREIKFRGWEKNLNKMIDLKKYRSTKTDVV